MIDFPVPELSPNAWAIIFNRKIGSQSATLAGDSFADASTQPQ